MRKLYVLIALAVAFSLSGCSHGILTKKADCEDAGDYWKCNQWNEIR